MNDPLGWLRGRRGAAIYARGPDDGTIPPTLRVVESWWEPVRQRTLILVEQPPGGPVWPYCLQRVAPDEEPPRYRSLAALLQAARELAEAVKAVKERTG